MAHGPPGPAADSVRTPLLTFPAAGSSVGGLRLDPAAGVPRHLEGGRTSTVHTLSPHGLLGSAWQRKPAARAAFDSRGRPVMAHRPPVVHGEQTLVADATGRNALTHEGGLVDVPTGRRRTGAVTGEDLLRAAVFSPVGRLLAAEDMNGRLTLWDARTWRRLAVLRPTGATVAESAPTFSADGSLFAASTADGFVQVWETDRTRLFPATVLALGFTSGARELRIGSPHLADRGVPLRPETGAAELCDRAGGGPTRAEWRRYLPSVPYRDTCGA
ncbi:hypothetical protein ABZX77_52625 [Streptomyces sp. NPDC004237]|uniref:WD40 repeat domain-containing protein n=1 Tax=Streptomyces sp. NPDC004237 TaxID=3154455 RepID=UPI0033B1A922